MHKIPLEATLAGAYRFLFTRILSVIGTLWLPFVVLVLLTGGTAWLLLPHAWLTGHFPVIDDEHMQPAALLALCAPFFRITPLFGIVILVMVSMMMTGLMRLSLGQKPTPTFVYFSLGANVWRMALALLLCEVLLIVILVTLVILCALFGTMAVPNIPGPWGWVALGVLIAVSLCAFAYITLRLVFFVPAVVVAENRIGLGRSWELGGGNFWRIFVIYLLIVLPVGIVVGTIAQMTIMPAVMSQIIKLPHDASLPLVVHTVMQGLLPVLPFVVAVNIVQRLVILGLVAGAAGTAYNAVAASNQEQAGV